MDTRYSFKWALVYRGVAVAALLLGLALVVVGFLAGFGSAITTLLSDPLNPGPAIDRANPVITVLFAVLGVIVWQVGKTYALFLTLPRAAGRAAAKRLNSEQRSDNVVADLDDRLAAIEAEIAETRRGVEALEASGRTTRYDERDHLESESSTAVEDETASSSGLSSDTGDDSSGGSDSKGGGDSSDEVDSHPVPSSVSGSGSDADERASASQDETTKGENTAETDPVGRTADDSTSK